MSNIFSILSSHSRTAYLLDPEYNLYLTYVMLDRKLLYTWGWALGDLALLGLRRPRVLLLALLAWGLGGGRGFWVTHFCNSVMISVSLPINASENCIHYFIKDNVSLLRWMWRLEFNEMYVINSVYTLTIVAVRLVVVFFGARGDAGQANSRPHSAICKIYHFKLQWL